MAVSWLSSCIERGPAMLPWTITSIQFESTRNDIHSTQSLSIPFFRFRLHIWIFRSKTSSLFQIYQSPSVPASTAANDWDRLPSVTTPMREDHTISQSPRSIVLILPLSTPHFDLASPCPVYSRGACIIYPPTSPVDKSALQRYDDGVTTTTNHPLLSWFRFLCLNNVCPGRPWLGRAIWVSTNQRRATGIAPYWGELPQSIPAPSHWQYPCNKWCVYRSTR